MFRKVFPAAVCGSLLCGLALCDDDPVAKRLAAAKAEYEKAAAKARDVLLSDLQKKIDALQKEGKLKDLEAAEAEFKAFGGTGELPRSVPTKAYEAELKRVREKAEAVYEAAVRDYTRAGKRDEARAAQKALDEIRAALVAASTAHFFNGKDLTGWSGVPGRWAVRDGAIVGATPRDGPGNISFLMSQKEYGDFELKCRVKISDAALANSGIQFRSKLIDPKQFRVQGPHCDLGRTYWGNLYWENMKGTTVGDEAVVAKVLKPEDFNELTIRCVGRRVVIKLNGETTVDKEFAQLPARGLIGWQLPDKGHEVVIKDIEFRELPAK